MYKSVNQRWSAVCTVRHCDCTVGYLFANYIFLFDTNQVEANLSENFECCLKYAFYNVIIKIHCLQIQVKLAICWIIPHT